MNRELIKKIKRPIVYNGKEYINGSDFLEKAAFVGDIKIIIKKKIPCNKVFKIKNYMCDSENLFMMDFHRKYNGGICCPKTYMKGVILTEDAIMVKIRTEEWIGWLTKASVEIKDLKED